MSGAAPNCVSHFTTGCTIQAHLCTTPTALPASYARPRTARYRSHPHSGILLIALREPSCPRTLAHPRDNVTALQANPQILASQTATANRHDESRRTRGVRASSDSECATLRKQHRTLGFYSSRRRHRQMTGEGSRPANSHIRNVLQTMHRLHKLGRVNGKQTGKAIPSPKSERWWSAPRSGRTKEYIVEW